MACFFATATVISSTPTPKTPAAPHSLSVPRALSTAARPLRLAASSSRSTRTSAFVARAGGVDDLPLVRNKAPDFEAEAVFDQEFINVKLSDYIGKKYVILFFYPLDFTFVCPTEITAFSNRYEEFEKLNTEIIGVSIDSVESRRGNGGLTSCEVLLFHHEDMGIPYENAKIGIRQGMWGCVKRIEPGLRAYQKARAAGEPLSQGALMAQINTKVGDNFVRALESNSDQSDIVEAEEKPAKNHVARFLVLGGAMALACTLDQGLLTKALIFRVARKFVGQRKTL